MADLQDSTLPPPDAAFWKRKLAAFLHDTPSKCLNIPEHREKSRAAMLRAGFSEEEVNNYDFEADWIAAAADRYPFPNSRAAGLTCAFDGERNRFHHPLDGNQQLGFKPIESDQLGTEVEQLCQPLIETDSENDTHAWRDRFFAHWRLWRRNAQERDFRLAFLPADTRIPDHTIWNHIQVVSALAGANADGGPAFLRLQIGGVQDFIAQARNTRDLWSGSYLLSWLMVAGLKHLSAYVGPDAVIFPSLINQPLFDLRWRDELWDVRKASSGSATIWDGNPNENRSGLNAGHKAQLSPNFPNVFLALVPANQAAQLGRITAKAIAEELKTIASCVWANALSAGMVESSDRARFDDQIGRFLNISWQAEPWPTNLELASELAKDAPANSPLANSAAQVAAIRHMAEQEMTMGHRDARYYTDATKTKLNSAGLAWAVLLAHQQRELDAVRQTRAFAPTLAGRWDAGAHNTKDALIGRDEALVGGAILAQRAKAAGSYWPSLFKKHDPIAALTLVKRTWHQAYLHPVWGFPVNTFKMPNTRGIASHEPESDQDNEPEAEDTKASEKYLAVLALDGDEIGKWVSGTKTPPIADQLANYTDGSGNATEGSLPYYKRQRLDTFLETQRPLSPSYHLQFSEALCAFALHCAQPIVESFDGRLIYAGGDDVIALLPADTALRCAAALRAAFRGSAELNELLPKSLDFKFSSPAPGFLARSDYREDMLNRRDGPVIPFIVPGPKADVSVGIAIGHFKAPLQDLVRAAQTAEKRAKAPVARGGLDRSAFSIRLLKHSGEILDWGAKWDQGGLDLHRALLSAMEADQLTGKFPHRLCEILTPYVSDTQPIEDLAAFPATEIIRREFARLLSQHEGKPLDPAPLITALDSYLRSLAGRTPSDITRQVIGLATAVAFAKRTL